MTGYKPEGPPILPEQTTLDGALRLIDRRVGRVIPYPDAWQQANFISHDEAGLWHWLSLSQSPLPERLGYGHIAAITTFPRPTGAETGYAESISYDFFRDETGLRLQDHIRTGLGVMTAEGEQELEAGRLNINAEIKRRREREAEIARQEYAMGLGRVDSDEADKLMLLLRNAKFMTKPRSAIMTALIGERPCAPRLYPGPIMTLILGSKRPA